MTPAIYTKSHTLINALCAPKTMPRSGIFNWLSQVFKTARTEDVLQNLPHHLQRDIGLSQGDIDYLKARKDALVSHTR